MFQLNMYDVIKEKINPNNLTVGPNWRPMIILMKAAREK